MRKLYEYVTDYYQRISFPGFLLCSAFTGLFVFLNYYFRIDYQIKTLPSVWLKTLCYSLFFLVIFAGAYFIVLYKDNTWQRNSFFYLLMVLAPVLFAGKMGLTATIDPTQPPLSFPAGKFWIISLHWPLRGIILFAILMLLWKAGKYEKPVLGMKWKGIAFSWYLKLFLYMLPFLLLASLTPDFAKAYPRLKSVFFLENIIESPGIYYLIYELCYGFDFFTIEIFFRGFLVLAFIRYAGVHAILPMAAFYCAIHFGKPLAECISSFFGGILLGIVIYKQRSVWGGFFIHLAIAWSMELLSYFPMRSLFTF